MDFFKEDSSKALFHRLSSYEPQIPSILKDAARIHFKPLLSSTKISPDILERFPHMSKTQALEAHLLSL
jgi:hypothetical protein